MTRRPLRPGRSDLYRHVRLRPRSEATEALYRARRPLVASILRRRPNCEIRAPGCTLRATCVDEIVKRSRGGSILDEANLRSACWNCNVWIEDHPQEALARGIPVPHAWEAKITAR